MNTHMSPQRLAAILGVSEQSLVRWSKLKPDDPKYLTRYYDETGSPFYLTAEADEWVTRKENLKYLKRLLLPKDVAVEQTLLKAALMLTSEYLALDIPLPPQVFPLINKLYARTAQ